jgi:ABC-type sugar transport system permease subunit
MIDIIFMWWCYFWGAILSWAVLVDKDLRGASLLICAMLWPLIIPSGALAAAYEVITNPERKNKGDL